MTATRARGKVPGLAYNQHETQDKWHTRMLLLMSMEPWAVTKKALHLCGGDTSSCLIPYPMVVPSFTWARPRTFHLAHMLPPMSMEPWAATKKAPVWVPAQC